MGLFDKLKKITNKQPTEAAAPAVAPTTAPEVAKEDFSNCSDLDLLNKIDQYARHLKKNPNFANFTQLQDVVNELDDRIAELPLSKKGPISQDWSFLTTQVNNVNTFLNQNLVGSIPMLADQICNFAAKVYTELSK